MRPVRPLPPSSVSPAPDFRGRPDSSGHRGSRTFSVHRGSRHSLQSLTAVASPVWTPPERDTRQCIGLLIPVYLAPLIIQGTRPSLCLYSVLLPLCWWLTSSVPRCVAAFAPILALPLLQIMEADETAACFFEEKSLEVTALLAFLTAALTNSSLVPRISFNLCSRIGLQVRSFFVGLACLTYVLAIFMNQNVVAMLFVLVVDKVLSCVHETELDRTFTERHEKRVSLEWLPLPSPLQAKNESSVDVAGADKLFDKLAKVVVNLNDEVALSRRGSRRNTIEDQRVEDWEIDRTRVLGSPKPTSGARGTARKPSRLPSRAAIRVGSIFLSPRPAFGRHGASLDGVSPAKQRQGKPGNGARTPPTRLQDKGSLSPGVNATSSHGKDSQWRRLSSPSGRLSPPPMSPSSTCDLQVGSPDVGSKDGTKGAAQPKKSPTSAPEVGKISPSKNDFPVLKPGLKSPGVTSPKRNADERKGKGTTKPSSRKSPKEKSATEAATQNKKPAALPAGTKADPASPPCANAQVVNGHLGIPSPTVKEKKKRRARIGQQAETVFVEVERELLSPERQLAVDIRRPSILKVPGAPKSKALVTPGVGGESSTLPEDFLRRPSTVDFGPLECHVLPDVQDYSDEVAVNEGGPWASPTADAPERFHSRRVHSPTTLIMPSTAAMPCSQSVPESRPPEASGISVSSPDAAEPRSGQHRRRFSVASLGGHRVSSPRSPMPPRRLLGNTTQPLGEADTNLPSDEKNSCRQRRAHESMRTAFVLCSSLVTVTGSLSSTITIAAKEALLVHDIVKPGPQGLLRWLILNTPTALLSTICCCVPLYYLHLKSRDVVQSERELRDVQVAATTKLRRLGPIRKADFLLAYGFISYLVFMIMGSIFHYNTRDNLLVFASFILLLSSAVPRSVRQLWSPQQRVICWSAVARDMPWPVVIVQSAVQLMSRVVERNNLLEAGFASVGPEFWAANSRLTNQMLFGVVGSVLAEMDENESLGLLLMPLVLDIARDTRVAPGAYAVPVALSASSNMILPIRLPLIVAHEVIDVPMTQLIFIGILVKVVMLITSIVSVNTFGGYLISLEPPEVNVTLSGSDTSLDIDG